MPAGGGGIPRPVTRGERWILALLVASIFINYVDRGSLSIAAPLLENELSLSPLEMGHLLGAFGSGVGGNLT